MKPSKGDMSNTSSSSPEPASSSSATFGFESDLWRMADSLRNNIDAAEYKLEFFESELQARGLDWRVEKSHIIWAHDHRNVQYHGGSKGTC